MRKVWTSFLRATLFSAGGSFLCLENAEKVWYNRVIKQKRKHYEKQSIYNKS